MCKEGKKLVVLTKLLLGSRELGWELWNGKEVVEMTSVQIKTAIKNGTSTILGLCMDDKGELQLDKEVYFMENVMCKAHIGNYKPLIESELMMMNVFYYVVQTEEKEGELLYHMVSSRFAREVIREDKLLALYDIGLIAGGVKVENGKIIAYDRVPGTPAVKEIIPAKADKQNKPVKGGA